MIEIDGVLYLEFTWTDACDLADKKFQNWWMYWNIPLFVFITYLITKSKTTRKFSWHDWRDKLSNAIAILFVVICALLLINGGIYVIVAQTILIYYDGLKWRNISLLIALITPLLFVCLFAWLLTKTRRKT